MARRPRTGGDAPPSREQVLEFLRQNPGGDARKTIARAFGLTGVAKASLKGLLRDLEREGAIERGAGRFGPRHRLSGTLPEAALVEIVRIDGESGEAIARPVEWAADAPAPEIRLKRDRGPAPGKGDRALVRIEQRDEAEPVATILRRVAAAPEHVLGIVVKTAHGLRLDPTDRRQRTEFVLTDAGGAQPGDVVHAEVLPGRRLGLPAARVRERVGAFDDPGAPGLIALTAHDIPTAFDAASLAEAAKARNAPATGREDLCGLPLVTIDGEDARDFDDAVFAEPDREPGNPGGFHLVVAIADVGWYVRPGSALDRDARERGNSVYLPDRVVPMLPERLSNELCSLKPAVDRAVMAVHIRIDEHGRKLGHRFARAIMRSRARLTYEQVQASHDGRPHGAPDAVHASVIEPLYAAYRALHRARRARGTLEIDLEERRVVFDADGRPAALVPRPRHDSHRLIEEFMIAANVCAAESLEEHKMPGLYRVHETPDPERVDALRAVLDGLGYRLARGQVLRPAHFTRVLDWAAETPHRHLVNMLVLRAQALAIYSPENIGHFGLALRRYAHFTSPIRRYADLIVHRALASALDLGPGGFGKPGPGDLAGLGEHLGETERRAAAAEREAVDRYAAMLMSGRMGAEFAARVSGVARFGLFVALEELGTDGLVPIATMAGDFWQHDERRHLLRGRRTGKTYTLGQPVQVRLVEVDETTGRLLFHLVGERHAAIKPGSRPGKGRRRG